MSVGVAMTLAAAAAGFSVTGSAHADTPCKERPTNVTSTLNADHTAVEVTWDAPSGCTPDSYAVYRKILGSGDRMSNTATTTGSEFSYTDTNIEPGKTYRYRIRSNNLGRRSGRTDVDVPALAPVLRDVPPQPQITYVPPPEPEPEPLVTERQMHDAGPSCPPGPVSVNAAKASTNSPDIRVTWSSPQSISAACTAEERDGFNNTLRLTGFDVWSQKATDETNDSWRLEKELLSNSRSYTLENFRDAEYAFRVDAVYSYTDYKNRAAKAWSGYGLETSRATLTAVRTDQPPPAYVVVPTDGSTSLNIRAVAWGRPDVYEEYGTQYQVKWSIPGYSISGRFVVFHEVTRDADDDVTANVIYICHDASNRASDSDTDWSDNLCSHTPVQAQDFGADPRVWPKGKFLLVTDDLDGSRDRSAYEGRIRIDSSHTLSASIRACSSRGCSSWLSASG